MNYTWDIDLFLWMNFDGGAVMDSLMLFASGKTSWIPLYLLILWLVYRKDGWRSALLVGAAIGLAVGMADIVSGIFKHSGPLENLWADFPVRQRPMHIEELEGLVHFIKRGGKFGTVSAHAATSLSIGVVASLAIRRRWFSIIMFSQVAMVCYSRIYLGYHFPQDILLGLCVGTISGLIMYRVYSVLNRRVAQYGEQ